LCSAEHCTIKDPAPLNSYPGKKLSTDVGMPAALELGAGALPESWQSVRGPHVRPPDDPKDYRALLADPRVRAFVEKRVFSYSLPHAETQDIVGKVFEALSRRCDDADRPDSLARVLGLASTVTEGKVTDYFRHRTVEQARIARAPGPDAMGNEPEPGPGDLPDVEEMALPRSMSPEQALAVKEKLAFVRTQVEAGEVSPDDIDVMQSQAAGDTMEELAAARGMPAGALRTRIYRVRKKLLAAWLEFSLLTKTTTIVLLILLFLVVVMVVAAAFRRREPPPPLPRPAPSEMTLEQAPRAPVEEAPSRRNGKEDKVTR
jgi:DNA-directed RNA polymerase specialized sigma24 family protein